MLHSVRKRKPEGEMTIWLFKRGQRGSVVGLLVGEDDAVDEGEVLDICWLVELESLDDDEVLLVELVDRE